MGKRHAGSRINAHAAMQVREQLLLTRFGGIWFAICSRCSLRMNRWSGGWCERPEAGRWRQNLESRSRGLRSALRLLPSPVWGCSMPRRSPAARAPQAPSSDTALHLMWGKHERWGLPISRWDFRWNYNLEKEWNNHIRARCHLMILKKDPKWAGGNHIPQDVSAGI